MRAEFEQGVARGVQHGAPKRVRPSGRTQVGPWTLERVKLAPECVYTHQLGARLGGECLAQKPRQVHLLECICVRSFPGNYWRGERGFSGAGRIQLENAGACSGLNDDTGGPRH